MGNTTIAYRWYEDMPLNKSTDVIVNVLRPFAITTDREGKRRQPLFCDLKLIVTHNQNGFQLQQQVLAIKLMHSTSLLNTPMCLVKNGMIHTLKMRLPQCTL